MSWLLDINLRKITIFLTNSSKNAKRNTSMLINGAYIILVKPCKTSQESCRPVSVMDIDINIINR